MGQKEASGEKRNVVGVAASPFLVLLSLMGLVSSFPLSIPTAAAEKGEYLRQTSSVRFKHDSAQREDKEKKKTTEKKEEEEIAPKER